jgi:hypothetical protein
MTLLSNLTITHNLFTYLGTTDFNDFNVTLSYGFVQYSGILYLGSGTLTMQHISSTTVISVLGTLYCETSTILFLPASGSANQTIALGSKIYNKIQFSGSHTGNFDVTGTNTIAELIIDAGRKVRFTAATTTAIGKLTIGDNVTIGSITAAQHTLSYTGETPVQCKFANISYSNVTQKNKLRAGASTNGGNNTNWMFAFFKKGLNYLGTTRVIRPIQGIFPNATVTKVISPNRATMI